MATNRDLLAAYLRERGILYASPGQPIRHRDGSPAPWAFYSWNATLTMKGLRLAALCILERLQGFHARQLATIGYTGMPLLSACLLLGEGQYSGLCIREQRKTYVSCRRVEGPFDKRAPVVIIDDSISSGTSLRRAIAAIEEEGAEVEGAIALVQFPYRGGLDWANAAGYRTEAILDIWSDLGMANTLTTPPCSDATPTGDVISPDQLHPAALARFAAATYLETGAPPLPPQAMDRTYDCTGGVFVSFRERHNENRVARGGFWHFDATETRPCNDIIAATIATLKEANGRITIRNLAQLKIAVTLLSALEPIPPSGLDFDRFGIVAQSRIWPHKRGGALPNTQVFISEIEQYRQAREVNARIAPGEPHDLFRHELTKYVEQGETWLPYGTREDTETAWWRDVALGARITARARALIAQALPPFDAQSRSLPDDLIPCPIEGVAVRLYQSGLVAYGSALGQSLDAALLHACTQASTDPRLLRDIEPASCAIVVSILHHQEPLGFTSISMAGRKLRRGLDALGITGAGHTAILLPSVLSYNNLSREDFVKTAALYAGLEREAEACQVKWSTFQCAEWMEAGERSFPLRFGFPDRTINGESNVGPDVLIRSLGTYIAQSVNADGLPRYLLLPATNDAQQYGTAGRAIHALMALDLAAEFLNERTWLDIVEAGLRYCLEHVRDGTIMLPHCAGGTLADAVLLSAVARHSALAASAPTRSIVHRLHQMLRPYGRFGSVFRRLDLPEDHEFLPGAALAGLGHYAAVDRYALPPSLSKQIAWYSYRFSVCPGWGSAGWLPQGMQAVHRVTADSEAMQLAFSATDWCIERQLASTGAFLEDLSPYEPSFNTGFIAEGVAASWAIALEIGDTDRASRYAASWSNAMRFMKRLIVFPEDVFAMRAGSKAVGGVRCMMSRSDIRIDQVSHCLHALITGVRLEYRMGELLQKTINGLDYAAQAD